MAQLKRTRDAYERHVLFKGPQRAGYSCVSVLYGEAVNSEVVDVVRRSGALVLLDSMELLDPLLPVDTKGAEEPIL